MTEIPTTCQFSTYGHKCGKPVEHGSLFCEGHKQAKCASCGQPATHGCDYCGQFVCGAPLCDECTYGTDESKPSGAWGFVNHIHIPKPQFADKHRIRKLKAEIEQLRKERDEALDKLQMIRTIRDLLDAKEQGGHA